MKVALIAFSVAQGAAAQYIEEFVTALSSRVEVHLFVPEYYSGGTGRGVFHPINTGTRGLNARLRLLNPWQAWRQWRRVKELSPDVVHILFGEGYPWSVLWSYWAKLDNIPLVATIHDPEPHPGLLLETLNTYVCRLTMLQAARVHIHSKILEKLIIQQGVEEKKISVIPHGSSAPRFLRYYKESITKEPRVLFFGRLVAYKGIEVLVDAAPLLEGLQVTIAGPGKLPTGVLEKIHARPEIFELHNRYITDSEVTQLFQRSAVCVMPYHQASQSFLPLISAALGVPVVATAVGSFVEVIPQLNGLLVPPGDPYALAKAMKTAVGLTPHYPKELEFDNLIEKFLLLYKDMLQDI
ncbi:glycosyltransferase family 4 protein [Ancylothrix sp. C2]|uniref:glycosyltransferase family 4 protein n=1 Tax=Ancylothrix sp. D3o TaxID=2953691 RepID=UPI0021BB74FA|nr:glycosyltransferase family 4 protein [Ancylothrix sp. D3o]MCT7950024.1 glycosyltransferase family 4 protein [Ancylothrix sp. D3o]